MKKVCFIVIVLVTAIMCTSCNTKSITIGENSNNNAKPSIPVPTAIEQEEIVSDVIEPAQSESGASVATVTEQEELKPIITEPPIIEPEIVELSAEEVTAARVEAIISAMTINEKIGQIFIPAFRKGELWADITETDAATKRAISEIKPGGIILFAENIKSISQTKQLINDMQSLSEIPLIMSVDEEGGRVSRLQSGGIGSTRIPPAAAISKKGSLELVSEVASVIGNELYALGFNMNFAPVADINTAPDNPVIGDRAFGSDAQAVSENVSAFVKGMRESGVCAVAKHFPGHGDTKTDTHIGVVKVEHTLERLREVELKPFQSAIDAGCDGIMVAHIIVESISDLPSTLSPEVMGLLRNELMYDGLIITDSLSMGAITNYYSAGEAAVASFKAGADILLMPADLSLAYNAMLDAVNNESISIERVDESVKRILRLKLERGLFDFTPMDTDTANAIIGCAEHRKTVEAIK